MCLNKGLFVYFAMNYRESSAHGGVICSFVIVHLSVKAKVLGFNSLRGTWMFFSAPMIRASNFFFQVIKFSKHWPQSCL